MTQTRDADTTRATRRCTLPAVKRIYKLLTKNQALVKDINKDVKNKFRWSWLERSITLTVKIGKNTEDAVEKLADDIAKCDVPRKAQCLYCDDTITTGPVVALGTIHWDRHS